MTILKTTVSRRQKVGETKREKRKMPAPEVGRREGRRETGDFGDEKREW